MISILVLIDCLLILLLVAGVVSRGILQKQPVFGKPPIPLFFFLLAKLLVFTNLVFLFLRGFDIGYYNIFIPIGATDIIALIFLVTGTVILFLSTFKLNKDLVFGLSSSESHQLQTKGIYAFSRHPFYLGFIFILFSSCLLHPNYFNALAFAGAWLIHHFIMIREEHFLMERYGDEYRQYTKKVRRYIIF